jgi:hypothetical protein
MKGFGAAAFAFALLFITGCLAFGVHSSRLFIG